MTDSTLICALALIVPLLSACVGMTSHPHFVSLSVSLHDAQGQVAERTLDASGQVEGSHLSGSRDAPMLAFSTERARPADLQEIARLVQHLPAPAPTSADLGRMPHTELRISFDDGTSVLYVRKRDQPYGEPALERLFQIIAAYRAGYW